MKDRKNWLQTIIHLIVYRGTFIERFFLAAVIVCAVCFPFVKVNYDLSKYLPSFAPTKQSLDVMEQEFGYPGTARIMVKGISMQEAKRIRSRISEVDGVDLIIGADTMTNVYMGNEFIANDLTDEFYKDGNAVMEVIFKDGDSDKTTHKALDEIYQIAGKDRSCFSGSAVSSKEREASITREITMAIAMALVIIWLILTLTTTSWLEPFLFIFVMIVAIILNMGSNIIFGTISFFTFSTAAILQLAVSMDYSIFLLHTFNACKKSGMDNNSAMEAAIKEACSSILASGATTIVGFIVIAFMRFTIGRDVGFVLTKGIICSLATVLLLMPTLILRFDDKIIKTAHRPFLPSFEPFAKAMYKIRRFVFVFAVLVAVPCYFGQSMNVFYYGDNAIGAGPGTRVYEDTKEINDLFGKSNPVIAMVPNGSIVQERELTDSLEDLDFVNYALSMAGTLPTGIPESFLPKDVKKQLRTEQYARIMISMDTEQESAYAFDCNKKLEDTIKSYYPDNSYVIGMTATTIDIRDILTDDYNKVSLLSLVGVALVVMVTFHSILVPILVIIPIEVAIYLNMTLPYVMGDSLVYIGYIIVSCLQLGATIDYSILMTNNYLSCRKTMNKKQAQITAISKSTLSIVTSGGILTVVGYLLYFTSSIQAISQVGRLVGRGALLSMVLVLSLLPALLNAFDRQIQKHHPDAYQEEEPMPKQKHPKHLKKTKQILAGSLAVILTVSGVMSSFASAQTPDYDETMYITMNPYGEIEETSVVKRFRITDNGEIKDYGNYKSVTNLTTHAQPETHEDGSIVFPLDGNEDLFYFEGETEVPPSSLPWTIEVHYLLNGVERKAEELAGTSGLVEINIDLTPNQLVSDYYRNNMALTAATAVDMDKNLSVRAEGAQIQSMGNLNAVLFFALPGEERHYTIAIGSEDFEFAGLVFMMIPLTMAQLDKVADIKEAKETLEDSADAVSDSLDIVLDSMEQMQSGISDTISGLRDLDNTRQVIQSTKDSVYDSADAARGDLDGLSATLKPFKKHTDEAQNALSDIKEKLDQIVYDLDDLGPKMGDLKDSVRYLRDNIEEIRTFLNSPEAGLASESLIRLLEKTQDDLNQVKSSQRAFVQAISGLGAAMSQINASSSSLRSYQALLSGLDDYTDYDPEDMEELLDYLSDYMDEDAGIELINDLKTASSSDADPIIPPNLQPALASILQSAAGLAGNTEVTSDISSMIAMTEQLLTMLGSKKGAFGGAMTDTREIADVIGDIANIGEDIISDIDDLDITLDYYYPEAINTLKDAGALTDAAAKGLDSLNLFFGTLEDQIKAVGEPLNSGTRKTLNGLADILERANSGLSQTETIRQAKDTIKDTIDDKWEEYTQEKTTILNLDPEAKPVSMTSSKNPEPNSIQIILRTKELTKEEEDSSIAVDESFKADGNIWHRIASIFRKIWQAVCSLFS